MHYVGRAAVLIAIIVTIAWAFTPSAYALPFSEAFGTFTYPTRSIDGDRSTVTEATGTPYRGEYFLVARFSAPSIIRKLDVRFEGKAPKDYFIEMGPDAITWRPYEIGEKATYIRVRMKATEGQIFKIAEIEANPEVAAIEALAPINIGVANIETYSATVNLSFTKPVRLSMSYGLEPRIEALKNFTEYTSFQTSYQIAMTDLIEGQDYYVRLKAISAEGELYLTDDTAMVHFRLLGTPPLKIESIGVAYVTPIAISLIVQTNIPSHCVFYFGEISYFNDIISKPGYDTRHVFEFKELLPNHLYNYMAFVTDFRGLSVSVPKTQITTAEVNIAKGKRVIEGTFRDLREPGWQGGGHLIGDTVLQRVTDGNLGYFSGMAHSGSLRSADQYAIVDLGRIYSLEGHSATWRRLAYPYYYEVHTSEDNKTWKLAIAMPAERISQGLNMRSNSGDPLVVTGGPFNERIKARYVKLLIPKGSDFYRKHAAWTNVDLAEFAIYPGGEYDELKRIIQEEWKP